MIPTVLHFVWVGSPLPDWARDNIEEWKRLHPQWGCIVWDDALRPKPLLNEELYANAERYVPGHAVGQFRADILRYEILRRHGGFYADVDTRPLRPIDDALSSRREFAVAEDMTWVGNTFLACVADSPVMAALVNRLHDHAEAVREERGVVGATVVSGPQYMTPIWYEHQAWYDERTELWFPYSWRDVKRGREKSVKIPKDAYAKHLWSHVRTIAGRPLE